MTDPAATGRPHQPRSLAKAISLTLVGQGGLLGLSFLASVLVARLLGPSGKGEIQTALIIAGVLGLLMELGLRAGVIRLIASGQARWKEALATMLALYGGVCLILLPIVLGCAWYLYYPYLAGRGITLPLLLLALSGIPLGLLEGSLTAVLIGHQRMPEVSGIWVMEKLANICLLVTLVWVLGFGVIGALAAQLTGAAVGVVTCLVVLQRIRNGGLFRVRSDLIPGLLRFGRMWYARNLATSLNYRLDALLVFFLRGSYDAGLYAVAVSLAELLQQLPTSIDAVLFPDVSSGEQPYTIARTARLSRFTVVTTFSGAIVMALAGYPILMIFGSKFLEGYPAMLALLPGMVVLGQSKVIFSELLGRGEGKYPAIASTVALVGTVILDLLLIPPLGIMGAAIASTIAYTISAMLGLAFYRRMTGIGPRTLYALRPAEIREVFRRIRLAIRRRTAVG